MIRYAPEIRSLPFHATLALALALLLPAACQKSPSAPPVQEPSTITLSTYRLVFTALSEEIRIDATVLDQDSKVIPDATVNWRSANRDVATVTDRGVVTATGSGTTQIIATSGYATATATVMVEQSADSIEIMPASLRLTRVGETGQFTALVYDSGKKIIPDAVVGWTSSHPAIASVDANGLVTAVSGGTAQVTASSGGESTSRPVHVEIARVPSRIELNISEATLNSLGQSLQLDARVYDADGAAIPGAQVTWTSSHPAIASVDADGLVIALLPGSTRVTASSGAASAHATIHVITEGPEPEPPSDRDALIALYNATDGPNWTINTNWLGDGPLNTWAGVGTDAEGRVTVLLLHENNLAGMLPLEISRLSRLEVLSLSINRLTGTIPPELGELTNLSELSLFATELTGNIPPELGELANLRLLTLGDRLTGPIPPELGRLTRLEHLSLGRNNLTGPIPPELGQLSRLEYLSLTLNKLTGPIPPELGQLTKLKQLWLPKNELTGGIPVELGNLANLEKLELFDNMLTGEVPSELAQLENLTHLSISENQLSGPIPAWLGALTNLKSLAMNKNRFSGPVPTELTQLTNLTYLGLRENRLTGRIPPELGNLVNLKALILDSNQFEGALPPELGNLEQLESIWLNDNQLSGAIPPTYGNLVRLLFLRLSRNSSLAGPIPDELTAISTLFELYLEETQVCAPNTDLFDAWLDGILRARVNRCSP